MRIKLFKRMIATVMAVTLSMGMLCGCGEQQEEKANVVSSEKETSSQVEKESEETKEPVVLEMIAHYSESYINALKKVNEKFTEKYPWITINLTTVETAQWKNLCDTRLAAGDVDLLEIKVGGAVTPEWAGGTKGINAERVDAGLIMDLTGQEFLKNWDETAIRDACTYNGKVYNVITGRTATNGLFYNKAIFEQYNLTEPKTWDEFINICETLEANGVAALTSGVVDSWPTACLWYGIVTATEEDPLQFVQGLWEGNRQFNDAETMKIWKKIDELSPYWEENVASVDYNTVISRFVSGKAAMMNDGVWSAGAIAAADPSFEFGYFAVPGEEAPADGGDVQLRGKYDVGFGAYANTEHKEEVLLWLEFYSQKDVYSEFIAECDLIPAMQGVDLGDTFLGSLSSKIVNFEEHFENMFYVPTGAGEYATFYAVKNLPVYGGTIESVEEIADLAQKDWDDAISKLKSN